MAKPIFEQNANMGVFLLGDFLRVPALSGWDDLRGDRASKCAQIDMLSRERVSVVKTIEFRVIFPETDTVFCETDMVGVPGRGNGGLFGPGLEMISESHLYNGGNLLPMGTDLDGGEEPPEFFERPSREKSDYNDPFKEFKIQKHNYTPKSQKRLY